MNQAACAARFMVIDRPQADAIRRPPPGGVNHLRSGRALTHEVLGEVDRRPQIPMGRRGQPLPELLSRSEVAALRISAHRGRRFRLIVDGISA